MRELSLTGLRSVATVVLLLAILPVGQASDPLPADELLKLEGAAFVEAAETASYQFYGDRRPYTAAEVIAVADRLVPDVRSSGDPEKRGLSPFSTYFVTACQVAGEEQLPALIEIYARLHPASFEKFHVLFPLASRLIAREAAAIRAERSGARMHGAAPPVPEGLNAAPRQLQEAWRTYRRAQAAFEQAFPPPAEVVDVSANEKSFYKLVEDALAGATGRYDEVMQFGWTGANCLGVTDTEDAQNLAVLLMLLRERRLDEAVGAALRVVGTEGSTSSPEAIAGGIVQLLEACGVDWQTIFAGAQAERESRDYYMFGTGRPYVDALGTYGSESGALLVHQLARLAKPEGRASYVSLFDSWIEEADDLRKCDGEEVSVGRTEYKKRIATPLPATVQRASLGLAEEFVDAECDETLAKYALRLFGKTQRDSSIPALQALTRHSSSTVAHDAEMVLCAMGQATRSKAARGPVLCRILLNGQPMDSGEKIEWRLSSPGGQVSSTTQIRSGGIVELPREHFGHPQRGATEIHLSTLNEKDSATKFAVTMRAPPDADAITDVAVTLRPLEIVLRNVNGLNAPPPETATVLMLRRDSDSRPPNAPGEVTLPDDAQLDFARGRVRMDGFLVKTQPAIALPRVQVGSYDVFIAVSGAEVWHGRVTVGPGTSRVDAHLQPGSDVRFNIVLPNGDRRGWAPLFKDGKQLDLRYDFEKGSYRALACGSYILRIAGSDAADADGGGRKLKRGPDEVPYAGQDVAFTVEQGSPPVIDLGDIVLKPVEL